MSEAVEMDQCEHCGANFIWGIDGSARMSIKHIDPEENSYFHEHVVLCPKCVKMITGEED